MPKLPTSKKAVAIGDKTTKTKSKKTTKGTRVNESDSVSKRKDGDVATSKGGKSVNSNKKVTEKSTCDKEKNTKETQEETQENPQEDKQEDKSQKFLKMSKGKIKKMRLIKSRKNDRKLKCQQKNLIKESNRKPILKQAWTSRLCHKLCKDLNINKRFSKKFLKLYHAVCESNLHTLMCRSVLVASKSGRTTLRPSHIHTQQLLQNDPSLQY